MPFSVSRIKQLWPWLVEARFAWLTLGVIGAALIVSLRPHTSESVIRLTGLVLQLLGIGTVIWGISETRALFGHPSFAAKAKSWFERFPLRRRNIVLAVGAASLAAATCKARGYLRYARTGVESNGWHSPRRSGKKCLSHSRAHQRHRKGDRRRIRKTAEAIKNEEHQRQTEDNVIRAKLEATGMGGVHISAIGASWLFVGVVLSTAGYGERCRGRFAPALRGGG